MRATGLGLLGLLLLPGCETARLGSTQVQEVTTSPAGAACVATRDGAEVGRVAATPGRIEFPRGAAAVVLTCTLEGYQAATSVQQPMRVRYADNGGGLIMLTSEIVDEGSGALYRLPGSVSLTLTRVGEVPAPPSLSGLRLR